MMNTATIARHRFLSNSSIITLLVSQLEYMKAVAAAMSVEEINMSGPPSGSKREYCTVIIATYVTVVGYETLEMTLNFREGNESNVESV